VAFNIDASGVSPRLGDTPINWRPPIRCKQKLAAGTVIAIGDQNAEVINVLAAGRIRIIAKYGAAGTLAAKWRLADNATNVAVAGALPATVALVANTENFLDIPNNPGHAFLEVSILDGGAGGTVTYVDVFMTPQGN
jgi:hypothetical protein